MSICRSTPNHTLLKYRCPINIVNLLRPASLSGVHVIIHHQKNYIWWTDRTCLSEKINQVAYALGFLDDEQ